MEMRQAEKDGDKDNGGQDHRSVGPWHGHFCRRRIITAKTVAKFDKDDKECKKRMGEKQEKKEQNDKTSSTQLEVREGGEEGDP
jgi:hypothetical protein